MSINSDNFTLLKHLPPYVFSVVNEIKYKATCSRTKQNQTKRTGTKRHRTKITNGNTNHEENKRSHKNMKIY